MASIPKRVTKAGVVYDVHYRDMTGASRQKSFRRKAEADKFRATVVADMVRGDWIDPRRARESVADWAAKSIASKTGLKPSSIDRCQVTPRFADRAEVGQHTDRQGDARGRRGLGGRDGR